MLIINLKANVAKKMIDLAFSLRYNVNIEGYIKHSHLVIF